MMGLMMKKSSMITLLMAIVLCVPKIHATDSRPEDNRPKTCKVGKQHGGGGCSSPKPKDTTSTSTDEKKDK